MITKGTRSGWSIVVMSSGESASCDVAYVLHFLFKETTVEATLLRYVMSSLVRSVKGSSVEQMRRSLRAKLKGIARLVCTG